MKSAATILCWLMLLPCTCLAYNVLLDIDTDGDPNTINERTGASSAVVRVVLQPTVANEWITHIEFGLGGSCLECQYEDNAGVYGTDWDLDWEGTLPEFPLLDGYGPECILLWQCAGNPGWHCFFVADAAGFHLPNPIFIATFNASVADVFHPGCPMPPADLMAFSELGYPADNVILLADPDLAATSGRNPRGLQLLQNHPNPFNPSTNIGFILAAATPVTLGIHDASGRMIYRRDLGMLTPGYHEHGWRGVDGAGRELPSGVYFYRVEAGGLAGTGRMVLLR